MTATEIEYGIHAGGLDDIARKISQIDVYDYVSLCPNPDLRLLTKIICKAAGKPIDDASIEKVLKGVKRKCV